MKRYNKEKKKFRILTKKIGFFDVSDENELPSFFCDDSETDKYESLVDFWLSWTLRCAKIDNLNESNKKLNEYAKKMLSYCLTEKVSTDFLDDKKIEEIKCWKYFSLERGCQIDVWFEILVDDKNYALIFENKVYDVLKEGKLKKYKSKVDEYYKNKNECFKVIYFFFRAHDIFFDNDENYSIASGYNPVLFSEFQDKIGLKESTKNILFDEFWINWGNYLNKENKSTQ